MQSDAFKVPDDPSELRGFVGVLMSELKNRDIRITDLEQRLAGMNRHRFGARSENADQLNLTLENAEIAVSSDELEAPEASTLPKAEDDEPHKAKAQTATRSSPPQ